MHTNPDEEIGENHDNRHNPLDHDSDSHQSTYNSNELEVHGGPVMFLEDSEDITDDQTRVAIKYSIEFVPKPITDADRRKGLITFCSQITPKDMVFNLDDVDRGILHVLQENAREATAAEMGEAVDVSASTVRNRISYLEKEGVIRGYLPEIDYERAGFELHLFIVCRTPTAKRTEMAMAALEIPGVINVREMVTGEHNLHIEVVAVDSDAADETLAGIEDLDLEIVSSQVVKDLHVQPFNHFGADTITQ